MKIGTSGRTCSLSSRKIIRERDKFRVKCLSPKHAPRPLKKNLRDLLGYQRQFLTHDLLIHTIPAPQGLPPTLIKSSFEETYDSCFRSIQQYYFLFVFGCPRLITFK